MSENLIQQHREAGICWLTLDEPERGNVLSSARIAALLEAISSAGASDEVSVIVIRNSGRIFCAGHDFSEISAGGKPEEDKEASLRIFRQCTDLMLTIMRCDLPVIASVNGIATAAGAQMVASCDLALASESAKFCTPGVRRGGFCTTPLIAIGRNMHRKHAMEMALTGDEFSAEDALRFGLINRVVPESELQSETASLASRIAQGPREAIKLGKRLFYEQMEMPVETAYQAGIANMVDIAQTSSAQQGMQEFLEGRKQRSKRK